MQIFKFLRGLWRLFYFAGYSSLKIFQIILMNGLQGKNLERSMQIRKSWARHLLPAIGVRLEVRGKIPDFTCLLMGNHRSYLDPAVVIHDVVACPVSKAEVARWPIVGYGAKVSGVLFLQRESTTSRKRTLNGIATKLREGMSVMLFPEGTTHADPYCHDLKPGGFKLAAQDLIPIVPFAIEYQSPNDYWVGNDTFLPHFLRQFSEREIHAYIHYGQPVKSDDPEYLMQHTKDWINGELQSIRKSF